MAVRITEQIQIVSDNPTLVTICPRADIDADPTLVLGRVRSARLHVGDMVKVVCVNHDRSEVKHAAIFLVTLAKVEMRTVHQDDVNSRTFEDTTYAIERWGDWWEPHAALTQESLAAEKSGNQGGKPTRKSAA